MTKQLFYILMLTAQISFILSGEELTSTETTSTEPTPDFVVSYMEFPAIHDECFFPGLIEDMRKNGQTILYANCKEEETEFTTKYLVNHTKYNNLCQQLLVTIVKKDNMERLDALFKEQKSRFGLK